MIRAMLISATLQVPVLETINAIHWLVKSFTIYHTRSHILYSGQLRVTLQVWIKIKMLANQIQTSINKYLKTVLSPGYCLLQIWCSHMYFIPSRVSLNRLLALSWNMQTTKTQTYTRPWLCLQRRPLKHLGSLVIKKHTSKLPAKILAEIILLVYWKITRTGYCWILYSVW